MIMCTVHITLYSVYRDGVIILEINLYFQYQNQWAENDIRHLQKDLSLLIFGPTGHELRAVTMVHDNVRCTYYTVQLYSVYKDRTGQCIHQCF